MPIAAAKLDTVPRLETVLTLRASRDDIHKLWPRMSPVDELASPGPAHLVNVEVSNGYRASVVFHERKDLVEILAPLEAGIETGLARLLFELNIQPEALTWTHDRINRRALLAMIKDHRDRPMFPPSLVPVTAAAVLRRSDARSDKRIATLRKDQRKKK